MPEAKENWFKKITPAILGRVGPGNIDQEVDREDRYKVVGPASAKGSVLRQPNTQDTLALAESQRRK